MRRSKIRAFPLLAVAGAALLSGCGQARQDASEPHGNYTVDVVSASFAPIQRVARRGHMVLVVRNDGRHTVPNLAVTVDSFSEQNTQPGQANSLRPVWIVNNGPGPSPSHPVEGAGPDLQGGDTTAYTNTWAAGPLPVGQSATLVWNVTPVMAGAHVVSYKVAAGLAGNAKARTSNGRQPRGTFRVLIVKIPGQAHVDPNTGRVVPGPPPLGPG